MGTTISWQRAYLATIPPRFLRTPEVIALEKRCKRIPDACKRLSQSGRCEIWKVAVLTGLLQQMSRFKRHSLRAAREKDVPYIAWATRNLLELSVWTHYVVRSDTNARRFYDDALIETVKANEGVKSLGKKDASLPQFSAKKTREDLASLEQAILDSRLARNDKYLNPGKVAEQLGIPQKFSFYYGLLSKFVHSTALAVLTRANPNPPSMLDEMAIDICVEICTDILDTIKAHLRQQNLPSYS